MPEPMTEVTSAGDTLVSQVTPLLGITPHEKTQLQSRNTPEDIADILGTRAFQRYMDTPLQTLNGIIMNQQVLIWDIFKRHQTIPDNIQDLHFHIDDFKTNIEKEFSLLKEATCKNVENFQSSLNLQQTYSTALCSHINNIYSKLVEIQQQLPHSNQHMNTGDMIQIEVPDFDPDIDEVLSIPMDQNIEHKETQGSVNSTQQF